MADFWIDLKKAPLAEIATLEEIPGITQITPRIQFAATVDLEHVAKPINSLVLSLPDKRQAVINDIVLKEGDYFTDRRQNEVIVNASFARHHNLYPGSWIHLLLNNRRQELFVVGTAISSEFTYLLGPGALVPDPSSFGVFYLKQSFAEEVFDFDGAANQVVGRLAPQQQQRIDALLAAGGTAAGTVRCLRRPRRSSCRFRTSFWRARSPAWAPRRRSFRPSSWSWPPWCSTC